MGYWKNLKTDSANYNYILTDWEVEMDYKVVKVTALSHSSDGSTGETVVSFSHDIYHKWGEDNPFEGKEFRVRVLNNDEVIYSKSFKDGYIEFKEDIGYVRNGTITLNLDEYIPSYYTVTFRDYNGEILKVERDILEYTSATPPPSPNSRPGYKFAGWDIGYNNIKSNTTIRATYKYIAVPDYISLSTEITSGIKTEIEWGNAIGAEKYELQRNLDSKGYTQVYSGSSKNYVDVIPKGVKTVQYRIRAYAEGNYGGYIESIIATVRDFPGIKIRINNNIKTSEMGWVKIESKLREIENIWVKINGIAKEVK